MSKPPWITLTEAVSKDWHALGLPRMVPRIQKTIFDSTQTFLEYKEATDRFRRFAHFRFLGKETQIDLLNEDAVVVGRILTWVGHVHHTANRKP